MKENFAESLINMSFPKIFPTIRKIYRKYNIKIFPKIQNFSGHIILFSKKTKNFPAYMVIFNFFSHFFVNLVTFLLQLLITYSEPLKKFRSPRKQLPDKSENNLPNLADIGRVNKTFAESVMNEVYSHVPPPPFTPI